MHDEEKANEGGQNIDKQIFMLEKEGEKKGTEKEGKEK
jgi:hypothetical protein